MKRLEHSDFSPHIGSIFSFSTEINGSTVEEDLLLKSVSIFDLHPKDGRVGNTSNTLRTVPFSVFFEGVGNRPLPQMTLSATHPGFEEPLLLFLVCVGPNESNNGFLYEASFG